MHKHWLIALLAATLQANAAVEVNHATALDLESIKGIGPSIAGRILAERNARRFSDWQDFIERVPGIGARRAARLSEQGLTVNG
jgi:competence protein ComEA